IQWPIINNCLSPITMTRFFLQETVVAMAGWSDALFREAWADGTVGIRPSGWLTPMKWPTVKALYRVTRAVVSLLLMSRQVIRNLVMRMLTVRRGGGPRECEICMWVETHVSMQPLISMVRISEGESWNFGKLEQMAEGMRAGTTTRQAIC